MSKKEKKEETLGSEHLLPWEHGPAASEKKAQQTLLDIVESDLPEMKFEDDDQSRLSESAEPDEDEETSTSDS